MENTKQKASIQSINNDDLNFEATREGKCDASECRRMRYNVDCCFWLRQLKLHGENVPKTASLRHCEKIVLLGGT